MPQHPKTLRCQLASLVALAAYMTFLALLPLYSRSPGASSGVAPLRRTTTYCLQRRALSETFSERLYHQQPDIIQKQGAKNDYRNRRSTRTA